MNLTNLNYLSTSIVREYLPDIRIAVDITLGNGYDIEKFIPMVQSKMIAFDIQEKAIEDSKKRLSENLSLLEFQKIQFVCDSHENIDQYVNSADLIFGNLGYLPNSDHKITTKPYTTLLCLNKGLNILRPGGLMSIVSYLGHDRGQEHQIIYSFFESIDPKKFKVTAINPINQNTASPKLFICQKVYE